MLFKIKAIFAFVVLFSIQMQAQITLSGKIIDSETGETLPGAHIKLAEKLTISANDGSFKFSDIHSGSYQLEVSYLGYAVYRKSLIIDANQTLEVKLEVSPQMEDAVVIEAYRATDKTGVNFTNLGKADIKKADGGRDIPYLLEMVPGLITNSDAGTGIGYTSMRIRGTDLTRINVTINGIPFNDPESQGAYFVDLPDLAGSLNSIQVQRGVGTSVNGPSSFGATIDMQTQGLEVDPFGEVAFSFGSFNTMKTRLSASTGLLKNNYTFDVRLSDVHSDGYVDRATTDLKSYFVSAGRYGKNSILRINVFSGHERTYQAWYGIPKDSLATNRTFNPYTYKDEVDDYTQSHFQLLYSLKPAKNWIINSALHYTKGKGFYENYKADASLSNYGISDYIIGNDTIRESDLVQRKWLDNDFYGFIINANYSSKKLKLIFGGGLNQYDGNHYGEIIWAEYALMGKDFEWYRNMGLKTDFNIYSKAVWYLNTQLSAYGDMQFRRVMYSMEGLHDDLHDLTSDYEFNFANPKAGLVYVVSDKHQIYSSFAIANREPSRNNFRDADFGYTPKSERLNDFELGYSYNGNVSLLRVNFYWMQYKNQLVETGKVNNVGMPVMTNVDKSHRAGVELIAGWNPTKYLSWNFNIALSENKIDNFVEYVDNWDSWAQESKSLGTTDIAFSPSVVLKNSIDIQLIKELVIRLQTRYVSRQFIDNTSNLERSINPYLVSDIIAEYTPKIKSFKNLSLNLRINNVFDEEYETNAWVYRYRTGGQEYVMDGYFPQAGIHFNAGVSMKF